MQQDKAITIAKPTAQAQTRYTIRPQVTFRASVP